MKNFIIAVLTNMPEILIDTTNIETVNTSKLFDYYKIYFRYIDGTPLTPKTEILKEFLKKHDIDYTTAEKTDEFSEYYSILFKFNDVQIKCTFSADFIW